LRPARTGKRITRFDLLLVENAGTLVSVDARLPNPIVHEALLTGRLPSLGRFSTIQREVRRGPSRLDFLLTDGAGQRCWLETKSVTLVENGRALFPDAPTERGRRQVIELLDAVDAGERAAVIFVVQRSDATEFSPHGAADPDLADALQEADARGVAVQAYGCEVSLTGIALDRSLPVRLPS
jgi:sugar fermentation stimulation protein A